MTRNVPNQVKSNRVVGDVAGRTCVLIDDMIDTGGTIAGAVTRAQGGRREGRDHRDHARRVLRPRRRAPGELRRARGDRHQHAADPAGEAVPTLTVLSIAPLLARTISEVFENGSVTSLFNGNA